MVLKRTIEDLKERPRHEREAVAFWIAIAVMIVLLVGWGIFFFRSLSSPDLRQVNDAYTQAQQQLQQNAQPKGNTGWVSSAPQSAASDASQIQIMEDNASGTIYSQ